jgi:hypothetical protein
MANKWQKSGKQVVNENKQMVKTWLAKKRSLSFVLAAKGFTGESRGGNGKPGNGQANHN